MFDRGPCQPRDGDDPVTMPSRTSMPMKTFSIAVTAPLRSSKYPDPLKGRRGRRPGCARPPGAASDRRRAPVRRAECSCLVSGDESSRSTWPTDGRCCWRIPRNRSLVSSAVCSSAAAGAGVSAGAASASRLAGSLASARNAGDWRCGQREEAQHDSCRHPSIYAGAGAERYTSAHVQTRDRLFPDHSRCSCRSQPSRTWTPTSTPGSGRKRTAIRRSCGRCTCWRTCTGPGSPGRRA